MTKKEVKEMLKGHYDGKIVDIDIYFNQYSQLEQATVLVIHNHIVDEFLVDESGFISRDYLISSGNGCTIKRGLD